MSVVQKTANDMNQRGAYWAVILDGELADLDDWQLVLKPPFDPWIETDINQRRVLRSGSFSVLTTSIEVRERALLVLETLGGAVKAETGASPVTFAGLDEVEADGTTRHHLFANDLVVGRPHFGRPELTGGVPVAPTRSPVQHWYEISTRCRVLADMLRHHGQQANWYNLYKTFEGVRRLSGGKNKLVTQPWSPSKDELDRFTRTADFYHQHAYNPSKQAPKNPMTLIHAATMINDMVRAVLLDLSNLKDK